MTKKNDSENVVNGETPKRLLVVDDERAFGEYVKEVAVDLGYDVVLTDKATDFMSSYIAAQPTNIVLDMVMPEIDGVELISWLALQRCTAKIIIVTGYNPRYIELAEDLGGAKGLPDIVSLTKPVALRDLRNALS
ncbi:hypothetical protein A9Q83_14810 [Alphaproteobacteria bacterium 46_93_T64]|nr:hypothetical protein A9Q83_14810 [Alphaproteobacteria bacterium 46_93_T64]